MSATEPTEEQETSISEEARRFMSSAPAITSLGDGIQAYAGLLSASIALPQRIIIVDEPEAFLHPPLARRLGRELALISRERSGSLVVATHSSEFLLGCLESGVETTIVPSSSKAGKLLLVPYLLPHSLHLLGTHSVVRSSSKSTFP